MTYELPPAQDKTDLFSLCERDLAVMMASVDGTMPLSKFILGKFLGISPLVSRELAFLASGNTDTLVEDVLTEKLWQTLSFYRQTIENKTFLPTLL